MRFSVCVKCIMLLVELFDIVFGLFENTSPKYGTENGLFSTSSVSNVSLSCSNRPNCTRHIDGSVSHQIITQKNVQNLLQIQKKTRMYHFSIIQHCVKCIISLVQHFSVLKASFVVAISALYSWNYLFIKTLLQYQYEINYRNMTY